KVSFVPIIRRGRAFQRVTSIRLRIEHVDQPQVSLRSDPFKTSSVLANGNIYAFATRAAGMYRLTYDFLRNDLGITNLNDINPDQIQVFGNGGGFLAENIADPRPDDLIENAITVVGGQDGSFDQGDYILLYCEGPNKWNYTDADQTFLYQKNVYSDRSVYFLKLGAQDGLRIADYDAPNTTSYTSKRFDDLVRLENDQVNLLHFWGQELGKAQGSGQNWYGDYFLRTRSYTYTEPFRFLNRLENEPIVIKASMALRAEQSSNFQITINNQNSINSQNARAIGILSGERDNEINYAERANLESSIVVSGENLSITVDYPYPAGANDGSQGWLDYIQVRVGRSLNYAGEPLLFRDLQSLNADASTYEIENAPTDLTVWDITNPLLPVQMSVRNSGNAIRFNAFSGTLHTYIAFQPGNVSNSAEAIGPIQNQNLHNLSRADMVIIYPELLEAQVQVLAEHRRQFSGLTVETIPVQQIYNEFSSGKLDPTAIRDFCQMLYQRDPQFRYLLLFGDGSFDARDRYALGTNLIPTYQRESFNPLFSFPADDYFGLLEIGNSNDPLVGRLNLAIGRLPVQNTQQAQAAVNKILHYDSTPKNLTDWRNRIVFLADDEDGMLHTRDADNIARQLANSNPNINLDKIYLDAFPQESTPGGNRIPLVTTALNQSIFKGTLIMTYLGHGGSRGLAQERVLSTSDIVNWRNYDNLTLLMTATCSFTGYDDPSFTSAGEEAFLNERGGAIALMTTVRAVFASQNAALTRVAMDALYTPNNGVLPSLGEAIQRAKNNYTGSNITINSRKFTLIGDPAQFLAIPNPENQVITTHIDTNMVISNRTDTVRALQRVLIRGEVQDQNGNRQSDFSGIVYPTLFDKVLQTKTLGQDAGSYPYDYETQKNVIFRGRSRVTNGQFSFEFVVPKDIDYNFGRGKISYYLAPNQGRYDGSGSFQDLVIGGNISESVSDEEGPEIDVFMNTEDFVFGGITDPSPTLLVNLEDELGVNVVGNSIGHDLEAIIDEDSQNSVLLNDFFETELGDFTRGQVRFPLDNLTEGRHSVRIKAWDVANNSAEGYTEFVVANSSKLALEHVLNYPNPFTDRTCFQFDHNYANQDLNILIRIFSVSGRLVKTIERQQVSDGAIRQDDCIEWDGRDNFGDRLARGVYLYKVNVQVLAPGSELIKGESGFEKLVILK
ncbi:MAG: type IX secretion system sortase PorU, partial [Saprospiraceae bacterium]|nr:type IX secretion system sortase PorU [Saprospiraceae bacterium]